MTDLDNVMATDDDDTVKGRVLTFLVGNETYGIEIRCVTEIVGIQAITEMPEMPDYIKGIINLRGKIIPLMDVRLRFSKPQRDYDDRTCVIVIEFAAVLIGLIVDSVSEVLTLPEENIVELPRNSMGLTNKYVKYIGKVGSNVVLMLDCEKLLSEEDLASIGEAL